jgi:hypothetical protein
MDLLRGQIGQISIQEWRIGHRSSLALTALRPHIRAVASSSQFHAPDIHRLGLLPPGHVSHATEPAPEKRAFGNFTRVSPRIDEAR